jgi:hypothetical protein
MKKTAKQIMEKHTPEASVQNAVLNFLGVNGCIAWRVNTGGRHTSYTSKKTGITKEGYVAFGPKGQPDIQGWIPGKKTISGMAIPIQIETKRPVGGRKTWEQIAFIKKAKYDGCFAMFAKSVDEVIEEWERSIDRGVLAGLYRRLGGL